MAKSSDVEVTRSEAKDRIARLLASAEAGGILQTARTATNPSKTPSPRGKTKQDITTTPTKLICPVCGCANFGVQRTHQLHVQHHILDKHSDAPEASLPLPLLRHKQNSYWTARHTALQRELKDALTRFRVREREHGVAQHPADITVLQTVLGALAQLENVDDEDDGDLLPTRLNDFRFRFLPNDDEVFGPQYSKSLRHHSRAVVRARGWMAREDAMVVVSAGRDETVGSASLTPRLARLGVHDFAAQLGDHEARLDRAPEVTEVLEEPEEQKRADSFDHDTAVADADGSGEAE